MHSTLKRGLVVLGWAAAVIGWVLYQRSTGLGTVGALQAFIDSTRGAWWALLAFIAVYAIRPLVLFPATIMTIAGGLLFGPVVGVVASVLGANASAMFAYWVARSLGFEPADDPEAAGLMKRWSTRMRKESFVTVMLMRFAFLPYDLVNYAAGLLRIRPLAFLAATAIGSLPGTVSFTLAGASIESLEDGPAGIDSTALIASVVIFVLSLAGSWYVKRRENNKVAAASDAAVIVDTASSAPARVSASVRG